MPTAAGSYVARTGVAAALVALLFCLAASVHPISAFGAEASAEWDPPVADFGPVKPGSGPSAPREFVLTNTGQTYIDTIGQSIVWFGEGDEAEPDLFKVYAVRCGGSIGPGESCPVLMTFNPASYGPKRGEFDIGGNPPGSVPSLQLRGEGEGPWPSLTPERLSFPEGAVRTGAGPSPPVVATLENQGSLGMSIRDIFISEFGGDTPDPETPLHIVGGTCHKGSVLPAHESCTVEVSLESNSPVCAFSHLVISEDARPFPARVLISGCVEGPEVRPAAPPTSPEAVGAELPSPDPLPGSPGDAAPPSAPAPVSASGPAAPADEESTDAVEIWRGPPASTRKHAASIWFGSDARLARFECRLDRSAFTACSSPVSYSALRSGRHRFFVRVGGSPTRAAGSSPTLAWTVVRGSH